MPSLSPKDRAPLCLFTFEDGRRCRTPRTRNHPHFCFYHAKKEASTQATEKLGKDLAYFFSGDYLSACDLSTALSRLIPAVVRGDIKPKLARTVAYMFQTQLQAIHLSQREYINAFGTDGWRKSVHTSVNSNHDYLFPPGPEDAPGPQQPAQAPAQSPAQPSPQTSVGAGLARPAAPPASPAAPAPQPSFTIHAAPAQPPPAARLSSSATEAALSVARSIFPPHANSTPVPTSVGAGLARPAGPERSEEPRLDPAASASADALPAPALQLAPSVASTTEHNNSTPPPPPRPQPQRPTPTRDPYAVHYDHNYRLLVDGKPF